MANLHYIVNRHMLRSNKKEKKILVNNIAITDSMISSQSKKKKPDVCINNQVHSY